MASNGWELPEEAVQWLCPRIAGKQVLEFGSGVGSQVIADNCARLISIEHDPKYVASYRGGCVLHAPIVDGWYSVPVVQMALQLAPPDVVIVDGPPGSIGRAGLLDNLHLFDAAVPMLIDDVHRPAERDIAMKLASIRQQTLLVHLLPSGRAFATIGFSI